MWARPEQLPPKGEWDLWHLECGRGFGKTRAGAETIRLWDRHGYRRFGLVSRTVGDVRDTMIKGVSGLQAIYPPDEAPRYVASAREVRFKSGAMAKIYTDKEPELLRGPGLQKVWCDEPGAWPNLRRTWDQLMMTMREGSSPQVVATTTPRKRKAYRDIFHAKSGSALRIIRTKGSSYDNLVNLSKTYERYLDRYKGTRLARQEIDGMFLDEIDGALWTEVNLDAHRAGRVQVSLMSKIVIAIDPAVTSTERSNETGMVVCGSTSMGHAYVLADHSGRYRPEEWAQRAVQLYYLFRADAIIGEANNGGDLVERNITAEDSSVPFRKVNASRGKKIRAEPVSLKYQRGLVHHATEIDFGDGVGVATKLEDLEDQMTQWDPDHERDRDDEGQAEGAIGAEEIASPDRVDAVVWGMTDLFEDDMSGWGELARL